MSGVGDSLVLTPSSGSALTAIRYLNINLSYSGPAQPRCNNRSRSAQFTGWPPQSLLGGGGGGEQSVKQTDNIIRCNSSNCGRTLDTHCYILCRTVSQGDVLLILLQQINVTQGHQDSTRRATSLLNCCLLIKFAIF